MSTITQQNLPICIAGFRAGDHIKLDCKLFDHHAIFLEWISLQDGVAMVMQHTAKFFRSGGGKIQACPEDVQNYTLVTRPENPDLVLARAYEKLGSGEYNLLKENCEHFCHYCISGTPVSNQILRHTARSVGLLSGTARVPLVATELCYEAIQSIRSYMRGEITADTCTKNVACACVSVGGGLAGATMGAALFAGGPGVGLVVASLVGGALGQHFGGSMCDKLMNQKNPQRRQLLQESREDSIMAAYQTLGLSEYHATTNEEVNQAYRRLARIHHPDKGGKQEDFVIISTAMEIIRAARSME